MRIANLLKRDEFIDVDGFKKFASPERALQWYSERCDTPGKVSMVDGIPTIEASMPVDLSGQVSGYSVLPVMLSCGALYLSSNKLASLHGCPQELQILNCGENRLLDFKHGPRKVEKLFCKNSQVPLTSLDGLPEEARVINLIKSISKLYPLPLNKLLLVKGIETIDIADYSNDLKSMEWMLKRKLKLIADGMSPRRAVLEFQQELIDEGLEQWF